MNKVTNINLEKDVKSISNLDIKFCALNSNNSYIKLKKNLNELSIEKLNLKKSKK